MSISNAAGVNLSPSGRWTNSILTYHPIKLVQCLSPLCSRLRNQSRQGQTFAGFTRPGATAELRIQVDQPEHVWSQSSTTLSFPCWRSHSGKQNTPYEWCDLGKWSSINFQAYKMKEACVCLGALWGLEMTCVKHLVCKWKELLEGTNVLMR